MIPVQAVSFFIARTSPDKSGQAGRAPHPVFVRSGEPKINLLATDEHGWPQIINQILIFIRVALSQSAAKKAFGFFLPF
jgi:hypothetical protein